MRTIRIVSALMLMVFGTIVNAQEPQQANAAELGAVGVDPARGAIVALECRHDRESPADQTERRVQHVVGVHQWRAVVQGTGQLQQVPPRGRIPRSWRT